MPTITILLFGSLREKLSPSVTISIALPVTVGKLLDALGAQYETINLVRPSIRVAVNQEFATDETLISEGDELAIIPPVSGG